ncbi:MAG: hypothetical protein QXL35_06065 [Candidatus Bathyarchaeia archaeon]
MRIGEGLGLIYGNGIEGVEQADRSTVLRKLLYRAVRDWKKEHAAKLYGEGSMTLERAAMEAGVSVREMMEHLKRGRVGR